MGNMTMSDVLTFLITLISSVAASIWAMLEHARKRRERDEERDVLKRERHAAEHQALESALRKSIHDVANATSMNGVQIAVLQEQGRFMKEQLEHISHNQREQSALLLKIFQQGQHRDQ